MPKVTKEDLTALLEQKARPCLSLFMPAHKTADKIRGDQTRFKNLLDDATKQLEERGLRAREIEKMLDPAWQWQEDPLFWQHQEGGLAVFLTPGFSREYRVPIRLEPLVMVAERFYLMPLLSMLSRRERFYILALSQGNVRIFRATPDTIEEIEEGHEIPASIDEALETYEEEKEHQFKPQSPRHGRGGAATVSFGHGSDADKAVHKKHVEVFLKKVNRGVRKLLADEHAPLVLAGVEELQGMYRQVNDYQYLADKGIFGNPEPARIDIHELHEKAYEAVEPHLKKEQQAAAEEFSQKIGTGYASASLAEVVPAACEGRVSSLFVDPNVRQWGMYHPETREVDTHKSQQKKSYDLYDFAATEALLHDGDVFAVGADEIPNENTIAAVFRY